MRASAKATSFSTYAASLTKKAKRGGRLLRVRVRAGVGVRAGVRGWG